MELFKNVLLLREIFNEVVTYLLTVNGPFVKFKLKDATQWTTVVWSFVWDMSAIIRETSSLWRLPQNIFRIDKTRVRQRRRNELLLTALTFVVSTVKAVERRDVAVVEQISEEGNAGNNGKRRGARLFKRFLSPWVSYYLGPNPLYPISNFRQCLRVTFTRIFILHAALFAKSPNVWTIRRGALNRPDIHFENKFMVCLRLFDTSRSLEDLDDYSKKEKETIRYF